MKLDISNVFVLSQAHNTRQRLLRRNVTTPFLKEMFMASADLPRMEKWLKDSGSSSHMMRQKEFLLDYREIVTPENVGVGDG